MPSLSTCFEDALDSCLAAIQEQGKTVQDCLTLYPALREELEPPLRLVVRLQVAHELQAPPEFRCSAAIRMSNLIAARPRELDQAPKSPSRLRGVQRKLRLVWQTPQRLPVPFVVGVLVALLLLVGGGAVLVSAQPKLRLIDADEGNTPKRGRLAGQDVPQVEPDLDRLGPHERLVWRVHDLDIMDSHVAEEIRVKRAEAHLPVEGPGDLDLRDLPDAGNLPIPTRHNPQRRGKNQHEGDNDGDQADQLPSHCLTPCG